MAKGLWVVLNVDNVDKSLEFYKMLGLKARAGEHEGMMWGEVLTASDCGMILWNKSSIGPGQDQADLRAWLSGEMGKGIVLNIGVPNAQRLWEKVQGRVTVDAPIYDEPWGGKTFHVVDPDGFVISITDRFPSAGKVTKAKKVAKRATKTAKKTVRKAAKKVAGSARRR